MNSLKPFAANENTQKISVEVTHFQTSPEELLVEFRILGAVDSIVFPASSLVESRRDELWKQTCLECFFTGSLEDNTPYYEVNCSPNGDWNAYAFSGYRQGMREATGLRVKLAHREGAKDEALFRVQVRGEELRSAKHLGVTAVVEFKDGTRSYFALAHVGAQPDFHLKKSFQISL
ncbi:DOMON-like domain-containing protein [Bdellovibrio sp. NC01]|uniref:DOMON-like domain-containing protein n=1 Tax=Bdellovibrio sp. NC01 TaxID=2220073 RepID=UPI0011587E3C|nr:DOMON-like domain-containing protein [Bdellovibrio sp. NC01]QDK38333.1 hypothetical protein DOE51_12460 [Bdellovibrio sp. NC01]